MMALENQNGNESNNNREEELKNSTKLETRVGLEQLAKDSIIDTYTKPDGTEVRIAQQKKEIDGWEISFEESNGTPGTIYLAKNGDTEYTLINKKVLYAHDTNGIVYPENFNEQQKEDAKAVENLV